MKTAEGGDGRIYDRNCKAIFNAVVSNGIHRTSKNNPPPPHTHTPFSQKSKKAKHSEDYSPPIAYAHTDGILRSSLTDPLPHRERSLHGKREKKRELKEGKSTGKKKIYI